MARIGSPHFVIVIGGVPVREREREITSLGTMMVSLYIKTILMNNQVMFWMEINNMTKVELCE